MPATQQTPRGNNSGAQSTQPVGVIRAVSFWPRLRSSFRSPMVGTIASLSWEAKIGKTSHQRDRAAADLSAVKIFQQVQEVHRQSTVPGCPAACITGRIADYDPQALSHQQLASMSLAVARWRTSRESTACSLVHPTIPAVHSWRTPV